MNNILSCLNSVKKDFLEDFKLKYVQTWLHLKKVITYEESLELDKISSQEQVEKLFEILSTKSLKEFNTFIEILDMEDEYGMNYPWLAKKLREVSLNGYDNKDSEWNNAEEILRNGGVPFQINCLLPRKKKVQAIKDLLVEASNKRRWVVLHGMTGTGKSVLAAEVVRDVELVNLYFPGGIFWVSLGNIDSNSLAIKMKRLYQTISEVRKDLSKSISTIKLFQPESKSISTVENMNELNLSLKKIVTKKMLIILDDVWDFLHQKINVVKLFDVGCPILVTTKFPGEFDKYSYYTSKFECKNDLDLEESKELLSLYVSCEQKTVTAKDLPPDVDMICKKCRGSPFTLSHIGGWMQPYGNDPERWKYLKNLLENGLSSAMRRRHTSNDELDQIKEIVRLTIKPIEKNYKNFLLDFVIFPEDIYVPSLVFKIMWNFENGYEVDEKMQQLLCSSLVQHQKESAFSFAYGIHDLYLDILKEMCTDKEERHLRLVNNYLKLCKKEDGSYNFSLLPNDDYIYYYIAYHMSHVNPDNIIDGITLDDIYFDLSFMEKKLKIDPKDLLYDYQTYRGHFKNRKELEIYRSFADKHMYAFNNEFCDIIQLGLFEPADSIIYKKALAMALESKNKSYFKWCNLEEKQSHLDNLSLKFIPFEKTRHATISSDGMLIACVGDDSKIMIFSRSSGEDVLTLSGHSSSINYCVFNNARNKLVSASDDKTVRIFDINIDILPDMKPTKKRLSVPSLDNGTDENTPDMSSLSFANHFASVLCCCYSHDEDLIVSGDENGVAHVWQSSTTHIKCSINHHDINHKLVPVTACCFNSDATCFATSGYDSVKLWFTHNGTPYKKYLHGEMAVKGFCWSNNHIISVANNEIYKHYTESEKLDIIKCPRNFLITCCGLSPDGNYIACGTSENTVIVYLMNTKKLINVFRGQRGDVLSVVFTGDGNTLLSSSSEGYMLYDMTHVRNTSLVSFEGNLSVRQKCDDLVIASSNYFDSIEVRKGYDAELCLKTTPDSSEITACSLSNDCLEVVYGTKDGSVKVLNIQNNAVDELLPKHLAQINYITHFKNLFFTCSEDKTLRIWKDKSSPKILKGHQQSVLMCVPFKKSAQLLSCSKDGTLRVWDINSGTMKCRTEGHGNQDVRCCDISFDEKLLASASVDGTVKLWHAENGELFKKLECEREVRCCRFSPEFQILVSGCDTGEVRLWTVGKRPGSTILHRHSSCVYDIKFSKNGSHFLTIADDIKIWETGQNKPQTLLLPSSSLGVNRPNIWASDNFDTFVVILNSVLYVLKKIVNNY